MINKMKITEKIFPLIILLAVSVFAEIKFTGRIDRNKLSMDDQLTLVLEASGEDANDKLPDPVIPKLSGLRVINKNRSMSSSSSFQIIVNGKNISKGGEKKVTWQYVLAPTAIGRHVIPSIMLTHGGKLYSIPPASIEVVNTPVKNKDVSFSCIPQKRTVYVGEQFRCIFRISIRRGANAFNPRIGDFETELKKSFWVENLNQGQIKGTVKNRDGVEYMEYDVPFALYPVQAGKAVIPAVVMQYEERHQARGRDPFGDAFFGGFFSNVRSTAKQKLSAPVTITVKNLPAKPAEYSGGIGNFNLTASVDKMELPVGDALTYTVVLKGNSSMRNCADPEIPPVSGFEVFEPEKKSRTDIRNLTVHGTREYKYLMIPQREGNFTLEPVRYTYFDPSTKRYKTIESKRFSVSVTPGKRTMVSTRGRSMMSRQEVKQLGKDIRFIKTGTEKLEAAGKPLHRSPWFLLLQFVPVLAVAGSYLFMKQREKISGDVGYARKARSKKLVRRRLNEAKSFLAEGKAVEFYGALSKGITGYIGDVLNAETTGMTTEQIQELLKENGQAEDFCANVIGLMEKADLARFGESSLPQEEMNKDLEKAGDLLNGLKNMRKK